MKAFLLMLVSPVTVLAQGVPSIPWAPHDTTRPLPPVIHPAPAPAGPIAPPGDAVVLFNGADLSAWASAKDSGAAGWRLVDGAMEVVPGTGDIETRQAFGDCQLHVEWMTPPRKGNDQEPGNSGVFLMSHYEVQVLDSYENRTYADGMAGAVYGQYPPLANASRPPLEWQTYDIVFRRPRFDAQGRVLTPALVTVMYNGVLVQDHVALTGPTAHMRRPPYEAHPDRQPLKLQDHGQKVRFRSIWIRDLEAP